MTAAPRAYRDGGGLRAQEWSLASSAPVDIAAQIAALVAAQGSGVLDCDQLAALVGRLAADAELWQSLVVVDHGRRRYRLMYEDDRIDVWVLSWMPGQTTGFHDHGSSSVALATVQGVVQERQLRIAGGAQHRVMHPGDLRVGAAGYVHAVAHDAGELAVTIHAYSPPLAEVGQYRAGPGGVLVRQPQHGRQELVDHSIDSVLTPPRDS